MKYIAIILIFSSCSPQFHLEKFYHKGGKIEQVEKIVTVPVEFKGKDGKDSTIYVEVKADCPKPIIETRWKVRFDNKRFKDSLNHYRKTYADSLSNAFKTNKTDKKADVKTVKSNNKSKNVKVRQENKRSWWLFWLGLTVGVILMLLIKIFIRYLKTFLLK